MCYLLLHSCKKVLFDVLVFSWLTLEPDISKKSHMSSKNLASFQTFLGKGMSRNRCLSGSGLYVWEFRTHEHHYSARNFEPHPMRPFSGSMPEHMFEVSGSIWEFRTHEHHSARIIDLKYRCRNKCPKLSGSGGRVQI